MVRNTIKTVGKFLAATLFLVGSSSAWSAHENLLDPTYYNGAPFVGTQFNPRIDMSAVSLKYDKDNKFLFGSSNDDSKLTLFSPAGSKTFSGRFVLGASITSNGTFNGGAFSFLSNDPYFGFGNSKKWGNVFSGTLSDAGWSDSKNVLEFDSKNFSGWACDQGGGWCTEAERLWFTNVDGFPSSGWSKSWSDKNVNGTAVVPVPAAVWLLGSGLLGLIGVAKRKKA